MIVMITLITVVFQVCYDAFNYEQIDSDDSMCADLVQSDSDDDFDDDEPQVKKAAADVVKKLIAVEEKHQEAGHKDLKKIAIGVHQYS